MRRPSPSGTPTGRTRRLEGPQDDCRPKWYPRGLLRQVALCRPRCPKYHQVYEGETGCLSSCHPGILGKRSRQNEASRLLCFVFFNATRLIKVTRPRVLFSMACMLFQVLIKGSEQLLISDIASERKELSCIHLELLCPRAFQGGLRSRSSLSIITMSLQIADAVAGFLKLAVRSLRVIRGSTSLLLSAGTYCLPFTPPTVAPRDGIPYFLASALVNDASKDRP